MIKSFNLKPLINSYTRPIYNNIKLTSIKDNIFTNIDTNFIRKTGILLEELTDHLPIYANFNLYNKIKIEII